MTFNVHVSTMLQLRLCPFIRNVLPDPSVEREESSSSSENSGGGVVRKAFPSRKGKAGALGKRHVRSSSGYSSHNDETTFR